MKAELKLKYYDGDGWKDVGIGEIKTTDSRIDSSTNTLLQAKGMNDHRTSSDHDSRYYTQTEIDDKVSTLENNAFSGSYEDLTNIPSTFPPSSHNHSASDINTGTLSSARLSTTSSRTSSSTSTLLQAKAMNDHRTSGDHDSRYARANFSKMTVSSSAPSSPSTDDIWVDI